MASPVETVSTRLPTNRAVGTVRSAARMTQSAPAMSPGVSSFCTPAAPLVSTFSRMPRAWAACCRASAAM